MIRSSLKALLLTALFATPLTALAHSVPASHPHTLTVHDHGTPARTHSIASHRRS